jgi:hypothetical protein
MNNLKNEIAMADKLIEMAKAKKQPAIHAEFEKTKERLVKADAKLQRAKK